METLLTEIIDNGSTCLGQKPTRTETIINCANIMYIKPYIDNFSKIKLVDGSCIVVDETFEALIEVLHEKG